MTTTTPNVQRRRRFMEHLTHYQRRLDGTVPLVVEGKLTRMVGLTMEAVGCQAAVGGRCLWIGP